MKATGLSKPSNACLVVVLWMLMATTLAPRPGAAKRTPAEPSSCVELLPTRGDATAFGVVHTCGERRRLLMWGKNEHGQLGRNDLLEPALPWTRENHSVADTNATEEAPPTPFAFVAGLEERHVSVGCAGTRHTCVLLTDDVNATSGDVKCFGDNTYGQLGQGNTEGFGGVNGSMEALVAIDVGGPVSRVSCAGFTTCVLLAESHQIKCFGNNELGQAGVNASSPGIGDEANEMGANLQHVRVGDEDAFQDVAVGPGFVCGLADSGRVYCWGANEYGELGTGDLTYYGTNPGSMELLAEHPVDLGLTESAPTINETMPGNNHTDNATDSRRRRLRFLADVNDTNATVSSSLVHSLHLGSHYACAIISRESGSRGVKCWGYGETGVLGYESAESVGGTPGSMGANLSYVDYGDRQVIDLVTGHLHACALFKNQTAACYGTSGVGQSGTDTDEETIGTQVGSMGNQLASVELESPIWDLAAGYNATIAIAGKHHEVFFFGDSGYQGDMAEIIPLDLGICTSTNFLELAEDIRLLRPNETENETATLAPTMIENSTFAPSIMGNSTFAPSITGNSTLSPSILDNTTFVPTLPENATSAPSILGNATFAPSIASNATLSPSLNVTFPPSFDENSTMPPFIEENSTMPPSFSDNSTMRLAFAALEADNATSNATSAPSFFENATFAPSFVGGNVTLPPFFDGNATTAPSIQSNATMAPSMESNVTMAPSWEGNATTAPSMEGNATMAPSLEGNATHAPSTDSNATEDGNSTTLHSPYYIRNPLRSTTVVVLVHGPEFITSPEFGQEIELGPGETRYFDIAFNASSDANASLGYIVGEYWCKGDAETIFTLPSVSIGYDVPFPFLDDDGRNSTNSSNPNNDTSVASSAELMGSSSLIFLWSIALAVMLA